MKVLPPLAKCKPEVPEEVRMFLEWLEEGVLVALDRNYLRSVIFGVYTMEPDKLHECYVYNVSYNDQNRCTGSFAKVGAAPAPSQSTEADVADQAKQMLRNVVSLCNTLDGLPEERYLTMKMHFYEDITPADWQPQHFKDSTGRKLSVESIVVHACLHFAQCSGAFSCSSD